MLKARYTWEPDPERLASSLPLDDAMFAWIRSLDDFDLKMLLSDINEHGWNRTLGTIAAMAECKDVGDSSLLQLHDA